MSPPKAAYENAFEESRRRLLLRHWNAQTLVEGFRMV